jgi:hypothetical protein
VIHEPVIHIDRADYCCMDSWTGHKSIAKVIGWVPAPLKEDFCPLAMVCECPTCHIKWWTHYGWCAVPEEYLPKAALEILGRNK